MPVVREWITLRKLRQRLRTHKCRGSYRRWSAGPMQAGSALPPSRAGGAVTRIFLGFGWRSLLGNQRPGSLLTIFTIAGSTRVLSGSNSVVTGSSASRMGSPARGCARIPSRARIGLHRAGSGGMLPERRRHGGAGAAEPGRPWVWQRARPSLSSDYRWWAFINQCDVVPETANSLAWSDDDPLHMSGQLVQEHYCRGLSEFAYD